MSHTIRSAGQLNLEPLEQREVPAVVFALTNSQRIQTFDTSNPSVLLHSAAVTGLTSPGEKLTDIDVRVANGGLYGRSNVGRVYIIDPPTGVSTQVGGAIMGNTVGVAFDPAKDQLRAVNDTGGNLALDGPTGVLASLGLGSAYVFGDVVQGTQGHLAAISFTNNAPLAFTTQLYGIDANNNTLVRSIGDPSTGQLLTVGGLDVDITSNVGFDIDPFGNVGYIAIHPEGSPNSLFGQINLATGKLSLFGPVSSSAPLIRDIAVADAFATPGTGSAQRFLATGSAFPTIGLFDVGQSITSNTQMYPTNGLFNANSLVPTVATLTGLGTSTGLGTTPGVGAATGFGTTTNDFGTTGFTNSSFFPTSSTGAFLPITSTGTGTLFPSTTGFVDPTGFSGMGTSLFANGLVQPLAPGIVGSSLNSFNSPLAPGISSSTSFGSPLISLPGVNSIDSFNSFDTFNSF